MRRYRFRLERVQRVRQVEQDLAEARLAESLRALRLAEEALVAEQVRYAAVVGARAGGVGSYLSDHDGKARAAARVRLAAAQRRAVELELEARRDAWLTASRRVTALERLDERRRAEHALESQREEQTVLDEVAQRGRR